MPLVSEKAFVVGIVVMVASISSLLFSFTVIEREKKVEYVKMRTY
jgi:hypothetical protein